MRRLGQSPFQAPLLTPFFFFSIFDVHAYLFCDGDAGPLSITRARLHVASCALFCRSEVEPWMGVGALGGACGEFVEYAVDITWAPAREVE